MRRTESIGEVAWVGASFPTARRLVRVHDQLLKTSVSYTSLLACFIKAVCAESEDVFRSRVTVPVPN